VEKFELPYPLPYPLEYEDVEGRGFFSVKTLKFIGAG
jgi:hypothetical protein